MDIKSKSRKKGSFLSWLCFFLGVSILLTAVGGALFYTVTDLDGTRRTVKSLAENDVQKTREFQGYVSNLTFSALSYLSENTDEFSSQYPGLRGDAANLIVYGKNSKGNRVVLIVDDVPDNVAPLHDALDEAGYTVLVALSGEQALQRALQAQPDIVLLDAMMPGMDGFEVARRLKADARTAPIPVVFMTGLTETEHVVAALAAGGVDYVTKPLKPAEVLAVCSDMDDVPDRLKG